MLHARRRDHGRHRARRRAARRSSGRPLPPRPQPPRHAPDRPERLRGLRAEAVGGLARGRRAVPRQHPARAAARRARAVHGGALRRDGLDEPVDRHRARLAGRDDRGSSTACCSTTPSSSSSPTSRTSSARPARSSAWGRGSSSPSRASTARRMFTREGYFALPAYPTSRRRRPDRRGRRFAGGFVGSLAAHDGERSTTRVLRRAMAYGTALASFNVEALRHRAASTTLERDGDRRPRRELATHHALRGARQPALRALHEPLRCACGQG